MFGSSDTLLAKNKNPFCINTTDFVLHIVLIILARNLEGDLESTANPCYDQETISRSIVIKFSF